MSPNRQRVGSKKRQNSMANFAYIRRYIFCREDQVSDSKFQSIQMSYCMNLKYSISVNVNEKIRTSHTAQLMNCHFNEMHICTRL